MSFKMTGIWQRKDVEFPTLMAMQQAYSLINFPPFTIRTDPAMTAEYLAIYGADEAENLKANNMVQSTKAKYVKNGVEVPSPPKSAPPTPGPDEIVVMGPTGPMVAKKYVTVGNMTTEELETMMDESTMRCLRRALPELFNKLS